MTGPEPTRDPAPPPPGLPIERTALAWVRSAVAVAAVGALMARDGAQAGHAAVALAAGAVLGALALTVRIAGRRSYAGRRDGTPPSDAEQRRALALIAGASVVSGVVALAVVLTS